MQTYLLSKKLFLSLCVFLFTPPLFAMDEVISVNSDVSPKLDSIKILKSAGLGIAGYIVVTGITEGLRRSLFVTDYGTWFGETDKLLAKNPKNILFINTMDKKEVFSLIAENRAQTYKSEGIDVTWVAATSFEDLKNQFAKLDLSNPFDRVEWYSHGSPGKIYFGTKKFIEASDVLGLKSHLRKFTAPGAEMRFTSCNLGADTLFEDKGHQMLTALHSTFLQNGGRIVASPRYIFSESDDLAIRNTLKGTRPFQNLGLIIPQLLSRTNPQNIIIFDGNLNSTQQCLNSTILRLFLP